VRVDRYVLGVTGQIETRFLSSTSFTYSDPTTPFPSPSVSGESRHVWFSYVNEVKTHIYDVEVAVSQGGSSIPFPGGDVLEDSPSQLGQRILRQTYLRDTNGTLIEARDFGDIVDGDEGILTRFSDAPGSAQVTCSNRWICAPGYTAISALVSGGESLQAEYQFTFAAGTSDVTEVQGDLLAVWGLNRANPAGGDYSAGPPTMAGAAGSLSPTTSTAPRAS